jgi:hypothetical protein
MPCSRNRKTSERTLPYPSSKPKVKEPKTTKQPKTAKKPKAKPTKATSPISEQQTIINHMLKSEFVAHEGPLPSSALGDLSNGILPVFRAANFPDVEDYEVIEPSVRLASHLLQHQSLQHMLRTILKHGKMIPLGEDDVDNKPMYAYPHNTRKITNDDVSLITSSLNELAGFVTFRETDEHTRGNASTHPLTKSKKVKHKKKVLQGHRSRIKYSADLLETLTQATNKTPTKKRGKKKQDDIPLLLTWRFIFAVQLAHEVCHALVYAKDGHKSEFDTEPFFAKATTAEVGFAMEEILFGGSPSVFWADEKPSKKGAFRRYQLDSKGKLSKLVGLSVLWPWPCTSIVREYQAKNCGLWMRKADMEALEPKDVAWRVPLTDLAEFFDTQFWADDDPNTHLDRSVGFAFACDEAGVKTPAEVNKEERRRFVPKGYTIDKHKAIVKK